MPPKFEITTIGSMAAVPTARNLQSSYVLNICEQHYLIDCGEAVQSGLKRCGFTPLKINQIFISHLHGDHFYGLYGLISSMGLAGRKNPLTIYAPAPLKKVVESHCGFFEPNLPYQIICIETIDDKPNLIYENSVVEVWSLPLKHKITTTGYLFKEKNPKRNIKSEYIDFYKLDHIQIRDLKQGRDIVSDDGRDVLAEKVTFEPYKPRKFAYISDTAPLKSIVQFIDGVDLLFHETTFLNEDKKISIATSHSTTKDAAFIANESKAKKLMIGHFSTRYKGGVDRYICECRDWFENCVAAIEGETIKVG